MMCGITASFGKNPPPEIKLLEHRGPDQIFKFEKGKIHIHFARLDITGGEEGHVPVTSRNKIWTVFLNGEIYNFKNLQNKFNLPKTNSDTLVVANGLEFNGLKFLRELRGMFALICINNVTEEIFVARDYLGEKPLFFYRTFHSLYVASEIKALLKIIENNNLNPQALESYLRFGYIEEPNTIHCEIKPFPKGEVQKIDLVNCSFKKVESLTGFSDEESQYALKDLIEIIIEEGVAHDVKSGISLSSGVDSSALLESIIKFSSPTALVVDYPEYPDFSEAGDAIKFAKLCNIEYSKIEINSYLLDEYFLNFVISNDQPHADLAGFNYYQIFKRAKELDLKVVQMGHGPDEFFWGYEWYNRGLLRKFSGKLNLSGPEENFTFWETPALSKTLFAKFDLDINTKRKYKLHNNDEFLDFGNKLNLKRSQIVNSYLANNAFKQSDNLGMRFGIEVRSLFSDSRLYGWSQFNSKKSKQSLDKGEFREAFEFLRDQNKKKAKKTGFRIPLKEMVSNSSLFQQLISEALTSNLLPLKNKINPEEISFGEIYSILMLHNWLKLNNLSF